MKESHLSSISSVILLTTGKELNQSLLFLLMNNVHGRSNLMKTELKKGQSTVGLETPWKAYRNC